MNLTGKLGDPARVDASLSGLARGVVGSEILKIAAQIRALKAQGREICNLTVGDSGTSASSGASAAPAAAPADAPAPVDGPDDSAAGQEDTGSATTPPR